MIMLFNYFNKFDNTDHEILHYPIIILLHFKTIYYIIYCITIFIGTHAIEAREYMIIRPTLDMGVS